MVGYVREVNWLECQCDSNHEAITAVIFDIIAVAARLARLTTTMNLFNAVLCPVPAKDFPKRINTAYTPYRVYTDLRSVVQAA